MTQKYKIQVLNKECFETLNLVSKGQNIQKSIVFVNVGEEMKNMQINCKNQKEF